MPPASRRPNTCSNCVAMLAHAIRSAVAVRIPIMIARFRCLAGRPAAADDSIVSRQHHVDHDHLDQGHDDVAGDDIGHDRSLLAGSLSQPIWSVMFDPIQSSGPQGSQGLHVIG